MVWNFKEGRVTQSKDLHKGCLNSITLIPEGSKEDLLVCGDKGALYKYNVKTHSAVHI